MFSAEHLHADWYEDGVEEGDNCWRLDFKQGDNEFQAQLFGTETKGGYWNASLFLERDNRNADGDRTDYAYKSWNSFSDERAVALLASNRDDAAALLADEIKIVEGLPNDIELVRAFNENRKAKLTHTS